MTEKENNNVGVGVGVLILREGKVLLGKRHENPTKASSALKGAGTWTMPGGKLKFGETFEEAAYRETLEETGMKVNKTNVLCINNDKIEFAHFITIGLHAADYEGEPKVMEPDRITEWRWFDLEKLPSPLFFPSERVLENYKKNQFYLKRN